MTVNRIDMAVSEKLHSARVQTKETQLAAYQKNFGSLELGIFYIQRRNYNLGSRFAFLMFMGYNTSQL
jgi:hypothetical protein